MISGKGPHGLSEGNGESVYEQPENEVDGSCHRKEGSKYIEKGRTRGARGIIVYIQLSRFMYIIECL